MNYYVRDLLRWRILNGMKVRVWEEDNDSDGNEDDNSHNKNDGSRDNAYNTFVWQEQKETDAKEDMTPKNHVRNISDWFRRICGRKLTRKIKIVYTKSYSYLVVDIIVTGHLLFTYFGWCVHARARALASVHLCHLRSDHLLLWGWSQPSLYRGILPPYYLLCIRFGYCKFVNSQSIGFSTSHPSACPCASVCADLILTYLYAIWLKANM